MKKRTKQSKQKAELQRQVQVSADPHVSQLQYRFQEDASSSAHPTHRSQTADTMSAFFGYDISLVYQDLRKTVVVTSIVLACLAGVVYFSR